MNKLLTSIAAIAITASAQAERLDIGGYFSVDIPRSWQVTESGHHVNEPGDYVVYNAMANSCGVLITVINPPAESSITFEEFQSMTPAEFPELAQRNQRIGWSLPVIRKIELDGIPVLLFRQRQGELSLLALNLWIAEKHFRVVFVYTKATVPTINKMMESIKCEMPFMTPTSQNGFVGDF